MRGAAAAVDKLLALPAPLPPPAPPPQALEQEEEQEDVELDANVVLLEEKEGEAAAEEAGAHRSRYAL